MNKKPAKSSAPSATKKEAHVKRITESLIGLPTLPAVVAKMIELVDNPKTSAASLAKLISTDQALTAKILKLANSAYYGFPREISTVNLAIVVLGFNTVKDMGLSISVLDAFKGREESEHFDVSKFWEHSIACGVAAKYFARSFRYRIIGEAFVAGLLHDVGKVIFNQYLHSDFLKIMRMVHEDRTPLMEAEKSILGTSHAQTGGWLALKWNLPSSITEAILYHHEPSRSVKHKEIVILTSFADFMVRFARIGDSGNRDAPLMLPEVKAFLNDVGISIDDEGLERMRVDFLLELDKADAFLSILQNESSS